MAKVDYFADIDLNLNELQNAKIESITAPTAALSQLNRIIKSSSSVTEGGLPTAPLMYCYIDGDGDYHWEPLYKYKLNGLRAPDGHVSLEGNDGTKYKIEDLNDPEFDYDAVNLRTLNSELAGVTAGLIPIGVVQCATTANITLENEQTIDGYSAVAGDRVLVKNQTDETENGVYTVVDGGAWTRDAKVDNSPTGEIYQGVLVTDTAYGTVNAGTSWYIDSEGTGSNGLHTIGTDDITWSNFRTALNLTAGDGIDITGNEISVKLRQDLGVGNKSGLEFDSGYIYIAVDSDSPLNIDGANELTIALNDNNFTTDSSSPPKLLLVDDVIATATETESGTAISNEPLNIYRIPTGDVDAYKFRAYLDTYHGLEKTANGLKVKPKVDDVIIVDEDGISVAVDGETITIVAGELVATGGIRKAYSVWTDTGATKSVTHNFETSYVLVDTYVYDDSEYVKCIVPYNIASNNTIEFTPQNAIGKQFKAVITG